MTNGDPDKPGTSDDSDKALAEVDLTGRAAYNIVSDTITGLNTRKSDNLFQAISILVAMPLFAALGALLARIFGGQELPWYGGALIGTFAGLVIGLFASGIFLMIYRAIRHVQGKHE